MMLKCNLLKLTPVQMMKPVISKIDGKTANDNRNWIYK